MSPDDDDDYYAEWARSRPRAQATTRIHQGHGTVRLVKFAADADGEYVIGIDSSGEYCEITLHTDGAYTIMRYAR